jgi:tRNA A37 threonylcarbamoyladenosine synthetase subunit TsaC/SUA5/YrdC
MSSTLTLPGDTDPLTEPLDIEARIGHEIELIVDSGSMGTEPTTVLDLSGGSVDVLRVGRGDVSQFT